MSRWKKISDACILHQCVEVFLKAINDEFMPITFWSKSVAPPCHVSVRNYFERFALRLGPGVRFARVRTIQQHQSSSLFEIDGDLTRDKRR